MSIFNNFKKTLNQTKNQDPKLSTKVKNEIVDSEKESEIIKKENVKFWLTLGVTSSVILCIFVISCLINIYQFFSEFNFYLGIIVTALFIVLLAIFIIIPVIKMLNAPTFTLSATLDKKRIGVVTFRKLKSVTKNLIKSENAIPTEEKEKLKTLLDDKYKLRQELNKVYKEYITKDIDKIIFATSWKVGLTTTLSKNSSFDALTTIILNIRMIMQITVKCGYRPSYVSLGKLIFKVFRNALVAYSMQSMNVGQTIITMLKSQLENVAGILGSTLEGATNSLLTARVGAITRKYLFNEFAQLSKLYEKEKVQSIIADEATIDAKQILEEELKYA